VYDIFGYLSVSMSSGIVLEFEPEFSKLNIKKYGLKRKGMSWQY
jgi:hypothetical protein